MKNGDGPLLHKPDWPLARKRWAAFWDAQTTDRPIMDVRAPSGNAVAWAGPPERWETQYLDPDWVERAWTASIESTWFGGEAIPSAGFLMGGYALGCDSNVRFAENTVWHPHMIERMDGSIPWNPGPQCPWRAKLDRVIERLLHASEGKFLVGCTQQVPLNDLIALLRGTEPFLTELADDTELCVGRLRELFPRFLECGRHIANMIEARQAGTMYGYPGLWHDKNFYPTQADMSCMISPAMFERWVLTEMDLMAEHYSFLWYHLDGPLAVKHLPALLARPYIRCIQYVPGDGADPNGPAWIDLYRRVQAGGRLLDLDAPIQNVEYLIRRLRPEALLIRTNVATREDGEELLHNAVKWAGSHVRSS
jgi:5-methyltetrahydrofolate--homocysteine methyltransferase